MSLRRVVATAIGALLAGACASAPTVTIESYQPIKPEVCARVIPNLPGELLTQGKRKITQSPIQDVVAAWGDPVITLRCGVTTAIDAALKPEVITVNDIDWRYEELDGGTRFYSSSLQTVIRIDVPSAYGNPVDALAVLSDTLTPIKN